jgi:hypothetical protein
VTDYFTPYNQAQLDSRDQDLGSGAVLLLPDSVGSADHPHLMVQSGKEGKIYLMDRDNLGQYQRTGTTSDDVVQVIPNAFNGWVMSTPAFYNGMIYYQSMNDYLKAYQIADGQINPTPVSQTSQIFNGERGGTPSISANGAMDGIVWTLDVRSGAVVLHAYNADDLSQELYNSTQAGSRDVMGKAVKFSVPTIADGQVFVGTQSTIEIFGLLGGNTPRGPAHGGSPAATLLLSPVVPSVKSAAAAAASGPTGAEQNPPELLGLPELVSTPSVSAQTSDAAGIHASLGQDAVDSLFASGNVFETL